MDVLERPVAGPVRREVPLGAKELEAATRGFPAELGGEGWRGASVDVDELEGLGRMGVDRFEGPLCYAELLAGNDDEGHSMRHPVDLRFMADSIEA